jgi:hypothetical protein
VIGFDVSLLNAISAPLVLVEALRVTMASLDSPDYPPDRLEGTLRTLWHHHSLLGKDKPLNLMLVAQLGPRLETLTARLLGPMKEGPGKEYTGQLIHEITEAVVAAREKLSPPAGVMKRKGGKED